MEPSFDPAKDAANRLKHGLPLAFSARVVEDEAHLLVPTVRPEDGEERFKAIGRVGGRLHTAVFTWRDGRRRFVSVRRSDASEERHYQAGR